MRCSSPEAGILLVFVLRTRSSIRSTRQHLQKSFDEIMQYHQAGANTPSPKRQFWLQPPPSQRSNESLDLHNECFPQENNLSEDDQRSRPALPKRQQQR